MNSLIDRDFDINEISEAKRVTVRRTVSKISHAVTIAMLVFIMAVIFAVVWKEGVDRTLKTSISDVEKEITTLEEQHRVLRAHLSMQGMPEDLVHRAIQQGVRFEQIDASNVMLVGGEG